ncbi:MAG: HAD family hydrolase [Candidatus Marinimicrobia bacterium]|jgi:phosphoglycolate phosphatase|nr:HAD family hydrolase [Candidatus Neomarinimicrobiota bacterium]MDP6789804.1 HAD family hydrolase [Candidatus Neomarinimicrobiota bacterium]|tara:strand:+ start:1266 stop:1910 length:645 start_codon:yes stop_codon:yes gene_type:complete
MKYKHIIWDWNGTLLDDRWLTVESMNRLLQRRKMNLITEESYREVFRFPVKEYYIKLGFDFDKEPFSISGTEFIEEYNKRAREPRLHNGAEDVLSSLKELGMNHSILSASKQDILDRLMGEYGIADFLDHVVGQDNHYAHGKTEAGKQLIQQLEERSERILFVGDTIHDFEVAQSLKVDCALLTIGHTSKARLQKTGARCFADFSGLKQFISAG